MASSHPSPSSRSMDQPYCLRQSVETSTPLGSAAVPTSMQPTRTSPWQEAEVVVGSHVPVPHAAPFAPWKQCWPSCVQSWKEGSALGSDGSHTTRTSPKHWSVLSTSHAAISDGVTWMHASTSPQVVAPPRHRMDSWLRRSLGAYRPPAGPDGGSPFASSNWMIWHNPPMPRLPLALLLHAETSAQRRRVQGREVHGGEVQGGGRPGSKDGRSKEGREGAEQPAGTNEPTDTSNESRGRRAKALLKAMTARTQPPCHDRARDEKPALAGPGHGNVPP